jgi:acyl phosphate:glycerol-3-phosphate acyltransferase
VAAFAYIAVAVVSYLLGSIPTGFLVAKGRGIDIRTVGSGNIGATNVFRYLGKPAGVFVLLMDALKGWAAVVGLARLVALLLYPSADAQTREWLGVVAGISAILGHNYTCWLHFKGGKGIATSAGVLAALVPTALIIALGIWGVVCVATRYVSLGSIVAAFSLPFLAWLTGASVTMIWVAGIMGALAIYKHKTNIRRLLNGTENRIGSKKPPQTGAPVSAP